ncbi:Methyltransferase domain-containing protein [Pseudomonas reinekei]|uniref:Methyltransferase domain-containing protein n=1 Tax=Pseudomonas reinekei TaxID=395598 RepID=A0A1H0T0X8_PSERE|nr:Methyltransferase domain-containing protein [Pseudomonas reinekei]
MNKNYFMAPRALARERFLELMPAHGRILDLGCGAGFDAEHFFSAGYEVVGMDPSEQMLSIAKNVVGPIYVLGSAEHMPFSMQFHGIWARASLMYVPRSSECATLQIIIKQLYRGGVFYMSVLEGEGEHILNATLVNFFTIDRLVKLIDSVGGLKLTNIWRARRFHLGNRAGYWINCLAQRE